VVYATIVNRRDRLGDMLVKRGRISRAQLDQALAMQGMGHGQKLGALLVGLGAITPEELTGLVRQQVEETQRASVMLVEVVAQAVQDSVVIGDYDTVRITK
jgi:hypothetical protein